MMNVQRMRWIVDETAAGELPPVALDAARRWQADRYPTCGAVATISFDSSCPTVLSATFVSPRPPSAHELRWMPSWSSSSTSLTAVWRSLGRFPPLRGH